MDFKASLCAALSNASGLPCNQIEEMLETPPNPEIGDFALPCFKLAKVMKKAPAAIAAELYEKLGSIEGFSKIEPVGGYLNFFTDRSSTQTFLPAPSSLEPNLSPSRSTRSTTVLAKEERSVKKLR